EWEVVKLEDKIIRLKSGLSRKLSSSDIGLPMLRSNNLKNNKISFKKLLFWYRDDPQGARTSDFFLNDEDILVNFINSTAQIGKAAMFFNQLDRDVIYTTNLFRLVVDKSKLNSLFFLNFTNTWEYRKYIMAITKPAVNQASFTTKDYKRLLIPLPPLPEQTRIANCLSTWDRAIATTRHLLEQLKTRKKGLMQRLLTGEVRLPGFTGEWEVQRIGDHLERHKEKTDSSDQYPVLTSSRTGLYFQADYYNKQVASKDNTGYNVVPRGYFTYRHMSDDLVFKFNVNTLCDRGIVSTLYPVFKNKYSINKEYLLALLNESSHFKRHALMQKQGGSRTYMYFEKLSSMKAPLPPLPEQTAIAAVLTAADREIALYEAKLSTLEAQKRGLMQQLLTGQKRLVAGDRTLEGPADASRSSALKN
ncbi:restriction endonuclease subunit S, partial [Neolewinella agarilytica]|uniref:restriction endonuclease subunit S n=1 Tax=Neolewinella agarilytica TaxID=478744 RepID=UPI002354237C